MPRGRQFEEAFKIETVKYISENNKPIAQVAREVGVNTNTLHGWLKKYGQQPEIKAVQTFSSETACFLQAESAEKCSGNYIGLQF